MINVDGAMIFKLIAQISKDLNIKTKDLLYINASDTLEGYTDLFTNTYFDEEKSIDRVIDEISRDKVEKKFKIVFSHFPWGVRGTNETELSISTLKFLDSDGIGIYLMPSFLRTFRTQQLNYLQSINDVGYKVLAVIQMPEQFMSPYTSMESNLVFLTKDNSVEPTYFAKYEDTDLQPQMISMGIQNLIDLEMRNQTDPDNEENAKILKDISGLEPEDLKEIIKKEANLYDGIEENIENFEGFEYWQQDKEIKDLDTEYGGYKFVKLQEVAEIFTTTNVFEDKRGAVYIPAIGRTEVLEVMPTLFSRKKPHNYFQILSNPNVLVHKYLSIYLNSELGQKTIERELSKYSGAIQRLRIADIKNLYIPVPNLGIQEEIIENISKLTKISNLLIDIKKDLSLKPISSSEQLAKLDQIYNSSLELSEPELMFNDIKKGESTYTEFKQTFALDIKSKKREDYIIMECVKTVAGFMNTKGGNLYIGVADNTDITGVEVEVGSSKLYKSLDKYLNSIKDVLKSKLTSASLNNCEFYPVKIRGKQVLKIVCNKSQHQVFVDNKDTYVRMGPSTNKLEGPDLVKFSKERFD